MRGYVYLDLDSNLHRKDLDYIDSINPLFFSDNTHVIARKWKFNTEDRSGMITMFQQFKDLKVSTTNVLMFIKDIGLDINSLKSDIKEDADKV